MKRCADSRLKPLEQRQQHPQHRARLVSLGTHSAHDSPTIRRQFHPQPIQFPWGATQSLATEIASRTSLLRRIICPAMWRVKCGSLPSGPEYQKAGRRSTPGSVFLGTSWPGVVNDFFINRQAGTRSR